MISNEKLYRLSGQATNLLLESKKILALHVLRFKHLVDNGERGFDCTYAQMTRRYFSENREAEIDVLKQLRASVDLLIKELENV